MKQVPELFPIMFLGMNPSYDGKKDAGNKYFFYDFNNPDDDNIKAHQQYWKRMQDTACKLNVKLCHHDLFSVRETTQNKIIGLRSDPAFKSFFNDQLSLTLQIIKEAEPEIIVAINAGVRDIICSEKLFGSMNWDELLGADILTGYSCKRPGTVL